jgi:sugar O-acyltransferase (sialic acid O-acetyltransferase NeuD family)
MILFGAGGHCKVVIDILLQNGISINDIYDDNVEIKQIINLPVQKPVDFLINKIFICVGDNKIRKQISQRYKYIEDNVISNSAYISSFSDCGSSNFIGSKCTINAESKIGDLVIINTNAIIEHDCIIENYVNLAPSVVIGGNCLIEEGAFIGMGAIILPGIKIGKWATIGAGAIILKDVPEYAVIVGNPGKIIKYNEK